MSDLLRKLNIIFRVCKKLWQAMKRGYFTTTSNTKDSRSSSEEDDDVYMVELKASPLLLSGEKSQRLKEIVTGDEK